MSLYIDRLEKSNTEIYEYAIQEKYMFVADDSDDYPANDDRSGGKCRR